MCYSSRVERSEHEANHLSPFTGEQNAQGYNCPLPKFMAWRLYTVTTLKLRCIACLICYAGITFDAYLLPVDRGKNLLNSPLLGLASLWRYGSTHVRDNLHFLPPGI